jgi:hypothetical protein
MNNKIIGSVADRELDRERKSIQADFAKKHEELRKTSELMKATIKHCRLNNFNSHAAVWNVALHVNLVAHDLSVLVEDLAFERDNWKRRLAARHVALVCYEAAEDMQELTAKTLRSALDHIGVLAEFEATLNEARKPLISFWNEHKPELKAIRIKSAAHRDLDAVEVMETVENIDIDVIFGIGFSLGKILIALGEAMKPILDKTTSVNPIRAFRRPLKRTITVTRRSSPPWCSTSSVRAAASSRSFRRRTRAVHTWAAPISRKLWA